MNAISWLITRIVQFFFGKGEGQNSSSMASEIRAGDREHQTASNGRNFNADYRAATDMLKARLSSRYPDNFHARVGSELNSTRDFGDERAEAIDTASAAIAAALRKGATVKQAAEAGAASIGI